MLESQGYGLSEDRRFCKSVLGLRSIVDFICNEFIHGGHLIALSASAIALSAMILIDMLIRWEFLLIIYLGTYCIYNYDHYFGLDADLPNNSDRVSHLKKYHKLIPIIIVVYGIIFFFLLAWFGDLKSLLFGGLLLLSGLFYTSKVKKMTSKIVGFKNFYTALSFSLLIIFTGVYCSYPLNYSLFLLFLFVLLRLFIDTSFCDIKDIESDRKQNLLTLPIYLGEQRFLFILHIINFLSFVLIFIGILMNILPLFSVFLFFFYIYCAYYLYKSKRHDVDIHFISNVIVDGEQMLWPLILILGKFFIAFIK